jgi:hypothetical protein
VLGAHALTIQRRLAGDVALDVATSKNFRRAWAQHMASVVGQTFAPAATSARRVKE